jgi:copper transport protein
MVGIVVAWAAPAGAHASLVSSFPAAGAHLRHVPSAVSVVFDQPVKPDDGGLVILDSNGTRVSSGATGHPAPNTLQADLPASLGDGAYVANYTVTSVDGHAVSGGIVFLVGQATAGRIGQLARRGSSVAGVVDKSGQFLTYAGVLVAIGLALFLAFILREGAERRRIRRWCVAATAVGVVGMLVAAVAQVALAGAAWGAATHWSVDQQVLGGKFGAQCAVQIIGLAACLWSMRLSDGMASQFAAFYGLLASAGAFVLFGHAIASRERWLSIPADIVHVAFAAAWIGGLMGLVVVLRTRTRAARQAGELVRGGHPQADVTVPGRTLGRQPLAGRGAATAVLERPAPPRGAGAGGNGGGGHAVTPPTVLASTIEVVGRFSTMAGISVAVVLVAGVLLAVAEVGSISNLIDTAYGQILVLKVALVGVLVFVAAYNRLLLLPLLTRSAAGGGRAGLGDGWRRLLATVRVEALGVVAVLAVTSVLANSTPSNVAHVVDRPVRFAQTQPFEGGHVSLEITPNQALVNDFVVQFTGPGGSPSDKAESVSVYLTLPSQNVGPIETDMQRVGVGRFVLTGTPDPPIIGSWQITLQIQVSAFDEPDVGFVDTVR